MTKPGRLVPAAALALLAWSGTAAAGSLACRSVNGNVVCAGPQGTSCQTVDGRTECVSGSGDVRQSFGGAADAPADGFDDEEAASPQDDPAAAAERPIVPPPRLAGRPRLGLGKVPGLNKVTVVRDGHRLQVETGHARIELD